MAQIGRVGDAFDRVAVRDGSPMTRVVVMLLAIASTAYADGLPYGNGPCDDVDACEQACAKDATACTWGGHLALRSGLDVPEHRARASKLYLRACAKGDAQGCWRAGLLADPHDARRLFDIACSRKLVRACFSLAKLDGGKLAAADYERAVAIETAACRNKDALACDRALSIVAVTLGKRDDKRVAKLTELGCIARTGAPCPPPPKCDDASLVQQAQQAATAATDRSYADALAAQNLQAVALPMKTFGRVEVRTGQRWALDQVVDVGTQRVIVGFDTWSTCSTARNEYAQRADQIFRIVRAPRVVSTRTFAVCGCGPMCGGAAPARLSTAYVLPPGTTFAGTITIAYDAQLVQLQHTMQCAPPP